jgi:hypothetical protein
MHMPIEIQWDDEAKTIIRENYLGQWTWDNFFTMSIQAAEMMQTVDHRVDILANMKDGIMPTSGASMSNSRKVLLALPSNWGVIVVVTNSFVSVLASIFKQFDVQLGTKMHTTDSLEKAYQIITTERTK